jgi:hypothetical protein
MFWKLLPALIPGSVSEVPKAKSKAKAKLADNTSDHNSAVSVAKPKTIGKSKKETLKDTTDEEYAVLGDDRKAKKGQKVSSTTSSCLIYCCIIAKPTLQARGKAAKAQKASGLPP